ncbi:MAG: exodeoxyribonuclease VII large subunit, partial [Oscillospiraceae bacterium]|nr:exodeoxyribonuclease VII large subunit [Oscillospiraceae bacterium]
MNERVYSVSEINSIVKGLVESSPELVRVYVTGELSNYKMYPSGHHYFTMKDSGGALKCVMFRSSTERLKFRPENGMKVIAQGRVSVYPRDGAYQLYVEKLSADGLGDLHIAYEQLKQKLFEEGLFDPEHKKPLPAFPERIAVITSGAGAAVRDVIRILGQRYPMTKVIVMPVRVQGTEAPPEIVGAIRYANKYKVADLLIVGRGGGSIEDLWAFNDERVARAIYASEIPVISAVGHEPDFTIADFVADVRAATPSNGAEIAVPDKAELLELLRQYESRSG